MKKNHKHYIKKETKGSIIFILMILLAIMIGLVWNILEAEPVKEPDVCYPMANARISWEQSFHAGSWNNAVKGADQK